MRIDGAMSEFTVLTSFKEGIAVTAANDADVLQLVVATSDAAVRQRLMIAGLVIYIDPANKKKQTFGIRVPPLGGPAMPDAPPAAPKLTYVEMIGPAKDERHIVELREATSLEGAVGSHEGTMILELLMPLRARTGWPYAPGVTIGQKVVGLGLIAPDPPALEGRRSDGDRGSRGGRPGGAGGRGGGLPGGPTGRGGERSESRGDVQGKGLKIWTTIQMAIASSRD
jgi:hypothetical protein